MKTTHDIADDWDIEKVTITGAGTATPEDQPIKDCCFFLSSGSSATVKATGKTATMPVPTSLAEAMSLKIDNLDKLTFAGTDVEITIIWLGFVDWSKLS